MQTTEKEEKVSSTSHTGSDIGCGITVSSDGGESSSSSSSSYSSKRHRIVGTPVRFSVNIKHKQSQLIVNTNDDGCGSVHYTGVPLFFGIDDHPMTYYSTLSENCSLCSNEIPSSGYRCNTCNTNLCLSCSQIEHIQDPPQSTFLVKEHECELTYKAGNTVICCLCFKNSNYSYCCEKHKYQLCLLCQLKEQHQSKEKAPRMERSSGIKHKSRSGSPTATTTPPLTGSDSSNAPPSLTGSRHVSLLPASLDNSSNPYALSPAALITPRSVRSDFPPSPSLSPGVSPRQSRVITTSSTHTTNTLSPFFVPKATSPRGSDNEQSPQEKQVPAPRSNKNTKEELFISISVESAQDLIAADPNGLSDPFCSVKVYNSNNIELNELTGCSRSQTVFKTLNPVWGCNFLYPYVDVTRNSLKIRFEVWDYDEGWTDDYLGSYEFILSSNSLFNQQQTTELQLQKGFLRPKAPSGKITFTISIKNSSVAMDQDESVIKWREIVEYMGFFPTIPTYYQRFRYIFFVPNLENQSYTFYSVENSSILEQKFILGEKCAEIKENGRIYSIDFETGTQTSKLMIEPERKFIVVKRLAKWFWQDDGDVWKPFNDETQAKIWQASIYRLPTLPIFIGRDHYIISLEEKQQKNLKTQFTRRLETEAQLEAWSCWTMNVPTDIETLELLNLENSNQEFIDVKNFFHLTMPNKVEEKSKNTIKKITKICNPTLRQFWANELEMCKKINKSQPISEFTRLLWHGTSQTHPKIIYSSTKGWKVNYAGEGNLWGKGLYFSQDAIYSSGKYAYTTSHGTQLLLLAEVIVGSSVYLQENKDTKKMKDAPVNPYTHSNYDCVIGNRHGTWIFVCYESSRAYPAYMVEYDPNG